jgi:hypothetical protein
MFETNAGGRATGEMALFCCLEKTLLGVAGLCVFALLLLFLLVSCPLFALFYTAPADV